MTVGKWGCLIPDGMSDADAVDYWRATLEAGGDGATPIGEPSIK